MVNAGPVTTYGQNDMVLDNWGRVERWTAEQANSDAIHARGDIRGLGAVRARSIQGHDLVRAD